MGDRELRRIRQVDLTFRCATCGWSFQGMYCERCEQSIYAKAMETKSTTNLMDVNLTVSTKLIDAFLRTPQKRTIITNKEGEPYLERIVLKSHPDGSKDYVHIIYRSDDDRDMHDHPFNFTSRIVRGSYINRMATGAVTYSEGMVNIMKAEDAHSLEILDGPVVTIVHRGPKFREWGFHTAEGWVHHADYLNQKFGVDNWTKGDSEYE